MSKLAYQNASPSEVLRAQERVAMRDPQHLLRWLQATNRTFLVLHSPDLVEGLKHLLGSDGEPIGLQVLQEVVNAYRSHRNTVPSGVVHRELVRAPDGTSREVDVPLMKDDTLTKQELDRAIRQLTREMFDRNPGWTLEGDPL